jgi:hypothetical protein
MQGWGAYGKADTHTSRDGDFYLENSFVICTRRHVHQEPSHISCNLVQHRYICVYIHEKEQKCLRICFEILLWI